MSSPRLARKFDACTTRLRQRQFMDDLPRPLSCSHCGERIGVYEPLWCQHPDGSALVSGYLSLKDSLHRIGESSRFFHLDCLPEESGPPPS
jgi:hypothetical protein